MAHSDDKSQHEMINKLTLLFVKTLLQSIRNQRNQTKSGNREEQKNIKS